MQYPTHEDLVLAFQLIGIDFSISVNPNDESLLFAKYSIDAPHTMPKNWRYRMGPCPKATGKTVSEVIEQLMPQLTDAETTVSIYKSPRKEQDIPGDHRYVWDKEVLKFTKLEPASLDLTEHQ